MLAIAPTKVQSCWKRNQQQQLEQQTPRQQHFRHPAPSWEPHEEKSRFPWIWAGLGIWRAVVRDLAMTRSGIKCHFSPRMFLTAIEFQVRFINCQYVSEVIWFWILHCYELNNNIFCSPLYLQYFKLNDALFLMYAKMCILHTFKRESFKVAKHFRTTDVPATERFHTWKYWGENFNFQMIWILTLTHSDPGKWCSVEENSIVEWSCLVGIPQAR